MRALSGISVMRFAAFPVRSADLEARSLDLGQILMHELHDHSALTDSRRHSLH